MHSMAQVQAWRVRLHLPQQASAWPGPEDLETSWAPAQAEWLLLAHCVFTACRGVTCRTLPLATLCASHALMHVLLHMHVQEYEVQHAHPE